MNRFKTTLLAVLVLAQTAHASDWWNAAWTVRKKITLDTTATGVAITEPIGTAPVLLRLHAGNFQFERARESGGDIRFIAADNQMPLAYHIEKYDALVGEAFVWVKVPDLKPAAKTDFWLYYGNGDPQLTGGGDVPGTYDSDTTLVYHFAEPGSSATDSSGSGNLSQTAGTPVDGSFIGSGVRLDEKTFLTIPASASLQWLEAGPLTISFWVKPAHLPANQIVFLREAGNTNVVVGFANGGPYLEISRAGNVQRTPPVTPSAEAGWRHIAVVASTTALTLHLDGEVVAALPVSLPALNSVIQIGGVGFNGELDELQISKTARPPGFIKLSAIGQGEKGDRLIAVGIDEATESWFSGGYMGVIMESLTLDGWIVIIILGGMLAVSWWVMFSKAVYLNGVAKGNEHFMKEWHHVAGNLSLLAHNELEHIQSLGGRLNEQAARIIRKSSIYRIYNLGAEELHNRLTKDERAGGSKALSARSVQAIRAVLDGGLVRETQRLNRLLVLLTIAISGGPFLGLLGTVVGVMITFAAIAQQGEVNVNAIAPGISAALAATVAGLAVAIPALFGYNYLLSRVKDATSDMHVFIDEFITKLAESFDDDETTATAIPETANTK